MTVDEIRELINLATETAIDELEVQRGDNRVRIRRSVAGHQGLVLAQSVPHPAAPPQAEAAAAPAGPPADCPCVAAEDAFAAAVAAVVGVAGGA